MSSAQQHYQNQKILQILPEHPEHKKQFYFLSFVGP